MIAELTAHLEALHTDAFGWAVHCCGGNVSQAEEILQSAYVKIAEERAKFDGRSVLRTWWFGVIRLTALEEHRRTRFRQSLLGRLLLQSPMANTTHTSPADELEKNERRQHLRALLQQLPARQAEVLHLVFYQDLTIYEAAGVMRVSLGSARQHYERGKARLRDLLAQSPH